MPEGPDVDLDKVHESISETLKEKGGTFLKRIALTTAVLAAFAAVAALQAGATANEALLLKTEATRAQAEASDQWAFYQAKGIKAAVQDASRAAWLAASKAPPEEFARTSARYAHEQDDIQKAAKEKEAERDEKSAEADRLLARHHGFANSVALFQVAIALGALAALTGVHAIWWCSMLTGLAGIALFAQQLLR
jgi:cobalamin-dependent methionine synthase I